MTATPIYGQLVAERGEQRGPLARLQDILAWAVDMVATICGLGDINSAAVARQAVADAILYGPVPAPLVLEEPIYDGLVNEMGYPHCSPVEALVCYTARPRRNWTRHWGRP